MIGAPEAATVVTARGEVAVTALRPGDRVVTRDNGPQPLQWIGRKRLAQSNLPAMARLRPIVLRRGSLGAGLPERDIVVSPAHRILVSRRNHNPLSGERESLMPARMLAGRLGISQAAQATATYAMLLFDRPEVILLNGAWCECGLPTADASGSECDLRAEATLVFPELSVSAGAGAGAATPALVALRA